MPPPRTRSQYTPRGMTAFKVSRQGEQQRVLKPEAGCGAGRLGMDGETFVFFDAYGAPIGEASGQHPAVRADVAQVYRRAKVATESQPRHRVLELRVAATRVGSKRFFTCPYPYP